MSLRPTRTTYPHNASANATETPFFAATRCPTHLYVAARSTGTPLTGYTFMQAPLPPPDRIKQLEAAGYQAKRPYMFFREYDKNVDVYDTLTEDVVKMLLDPPRTYDQDFERKKNILILTALGALSRK
jgi:hypothetical protein